MQHAITIVRVQDFDKTDFGSRYLLTTKSRCRRRMVSELCGNGVYPNNIRHNS